MTYQVQALERRRLLAVNYTSRVMDINATYEALNPSYITAVGQDAFFSGRPSTQSGAELFFYNGSTNSVSMVKDIFPGVDASSPSQLVMNGPRLFFVADNGVNGPELWTSDGTSAGTVLVRDIRTGTAGSAIRDVSPFGNGVAFIATDAAGTSIWKSDGTAAGTVRMTNDNYSFPNTLPALAVVGNTVIFGGVAQSTGRLFAIDEGGLRTLFSNSTSSPVRSLAAHHGKVYFTTSGSGSSSNLGVTDGTVVGTNIILSVLHPGQTSQHSIGKIVSLNGLLYFPCQNLSNGKRFLYRSDGTAAGTFPLSTSISLNSSTLPVAGPNGKVLFSGQETATGTEIYATDGTAAGTVLLADTAPGTKSGVDDLLAATASGKALFHTYNGLWQTNGTPAGTSRLGAPTSGIYYVPYAVGNRILFKQYRYLSRGELWASDGTQAGTHRVAIDDFRVGNGSSLQNDFGDNRLFTVAGTGVYFAANDGFAGSEMYLATETGALLIADTEPGPGSSLPSSFVKGPDGSIYYSAETSAAGRELYRVNTGGIVSLVADIIPGAEGSNAQRVFSIGNSVYWTSRAADGYSYLYRYNTQTNTSARLTDSGGFPLQVGTAPAYFAGGKAYVSAIVNSVAKLFLIRSDNSLTPLANVWVPHRESAPAFATTVGGTVYFIGETTADGTELWCTNGAASNTIRCTNIAPGSASAGITSLATSGNVVYFNASATGGTTTPWGLVNAGSPVQLSTTVTYPRQFTSTEFGTAFIADDATGTHVYFADFQGGVYPFLQGSTSRMPIALVSGGDMLFTVYRSQNSTVLPSSRYWLERTDMSYETTAYMNELWATTFEDGTLEEFLGTGSLAFTIYAGDLYFPSSHGNSGLEPYRATLQRTVQQGLTGTLFYDYNKDQIKQSNEPVAPDVSYFVDVDYDGRRDPNDTDGTTDANGRYFANAVTGMMSLHFTPGGEFAPFVYEDSSPSTPYMYRRVPDIGLSESTPPQVVSLTADRNRNRFSVVATFSEAMTASTVDPSDLVLTNLATGLPVSTSLMQVVYDPGARQAVFTFPGFANGLLPDGRYQATIAAGAVRDLFNNASTLSGQTNFAFQAGDATGDGRVDFNDLLIVARNYNTTGKTLATGNLNGDAAGRVDFDDLLFLARRYGQQVMLDSSVIPIEEATPKRRLPLTIS